MIGLIKHANGVWSCKMAMPVPDGNGRRPVTSTANLCWEWSSTEKRCAVYGFPISTKVIYGGTSLSPPMGGICKAAPYGCGYLRYFSKPVERTA